MLSHSGAANVFCASNEYIRAEVNFDGHSNAVAIDPRRLVRDLKPFRESYPARSAWELAVTLLPFFFVCGLMLVAVQAGHVLGLVLVLPAGLLLLRLFLIQHDCGHGAFLPSRVG